MSRVTVVCFKNLWQMLCKALAGVSVQPDDRVVLGGSWLLSNTSGVAAKQGPGSQDIVS